MKIDYVPFEQNFQAFNDIELYAFRLDHLLQIIADNNLSHYCKTMKKNRDPNSLSYFAKRNFAITLIYKDLNKKVSKNKMKKTLKISFLPLNVNMYTAKIAPSSGAFSKILNSVLKLLPSDYDINIDRQHLMFYNRINEKYSCIAPIQCDMIIAGDGIFRWIHKKNGEKLVASIRK